MIETLDRRQWLFRSGALAASGLIGACTDVFTRRTGSRADSKIRLHLNENPYGPSEQVLEAMRGALREGNLYNMRIPGEDLRSLLAEREGLTADHVVLGCGSGEVLNVAGLIHGWNGGEIVAAHPTFEALQQYAELGGALVQRVALTETMEYDLSVMAERISSETKLIYVCNPNNPTGTLIQGSRLREFCEDVCSRAVVFVDEAYHEFVDDPTYRSMIDLVREGKNIIVSRTASKIHALAGLRIGFGFAHPEMIRRLREAMTGSVNIVALHGALAGYYDGDFQSGTKKWIKEGRETLYSLFERLGLRYLRSQANFVFLQTGVPIEDFRVKMEAEGILVGRPFPPYTDWCRVTVGTGQQLQEFGRALHRALAA